MPGPRLPEPYSVGYLRSAVKDSLSYLGEQAILLSTYHVIPDEAAGVPRCINYDDVYQNCAEGRCRECYGTTFEGGIKTARRVWAMFTDTTSSEDIGRTGVWNPDKRQVQTEWDPPLMQRDYIVRIPRNAWSTDMRTPGAITGIYRIGEVASGSLRQGQQEGQTPTDLYGQKGTVEEIISDQAIYYYPIVGVAFERTDRRVF